MSPDLIDPEGIPVFIGDLEQLSTDALLLTAEASAFRFAGADVHGKFQGLSACYSAPEAEQLFATTAPVAAKADKFADDLEKVGAALSAYEAEIQPLVAKLKSLRARAENFRADIAGDDHWLEDNDKVQLNNDLFYDVNVTQMAFWQAERTCHNKITALVHGTTLIVEDGAQERLVKRGTSTYGFTKDLLDQSDDLPWGRTVEKERHGLDWLGHQIVEFGKGFFVDGVWGTIRGLGTLVGFDGLDAMGEAWTHLSKLATGIAITLSPLGTAYWAAPDDKLPSYLRESRQTVTETGKALVAYDQWGKNPARAGGAVTFNALTTIFTGGAGSAAKSGAVARTIGALGKTGRWVDPMTYVGKAARFGTVKVADLFGSLKNFKAGAYTDVLSGAGKVQPDGSVLRTADDVPVVVGNHIEWPDGTRLNLDDGSVIRADGTHAAAKVELSAADRAMLERSLPHGDAALVGAGDGVAAHVGGDSAARVGGDTTAHTGGNASGHVGNTSASPGAAHAADSGAARSVSGTADNGHASAGSGGHGGGGPDDLGRTGDHTFDSGADGVPGSDPDTPARQVGPERPSFMRDGDNPYGPRGSLTDEQIAKIQVYRANHEPGYFEKYYKINGNRKNLSVFDESGLTPPQLTRQSAHHPWVTVRDAPDPIKPDYIGDWDKRGRNYRTTPAMHGPLDEAALRRHLAIRHDRLMRDWKEAAEAVYREHPSHETQGLWGESKGAYKDSHHHMGVAAEEFGETVAEHHYIAAEHPGAVRQSLAGPKNGNDQFDQVWKDGDRYVVIEAKSSVDTELGARNLPSGKRVSQGTREYFQDILREMQERGKKNISERRLARNLQKALDEGRLDYVVVKGERNAGEYAGYRARKFDIADRSVP